MDLNKELHSGNRQRLLKRPFAWVGKHTGLNSVSTTGILIGMVSMVPALAMVTRMDKRGNVVCGSSAFAAHLGFPVSTEPEMVTARWQQNYWADSYTIKVFNWESV